ncbi:hypothetical protein ACTMTJ_28290 [Phytohabitans sp. LJ34]|uniref:hypothetical protein n=1 Tax=Phytohabitans sp. LJ34 TaxID=3452217 RepID=UPI003F8C86CB
MIRSVFAVFDAMTVIFDVANYMQDRRTPRWPEEFRYVDDSRHTVVVDNSHRRGARPWLGPALIVGTTAAIIGYLVGADDRVLALAQSAAAVIALGVPLVMWLWRRGEAGQAPAGRLVDSFMDELAIVVRAQWERSAGERRLRYPVPASVRWRWSGSSIGGPIGQAVGNRIVRFPVLPGMSRISERDLSNGGLADLFRIYGGLDSGRIIIAGNAGSGKSGAAILLLLDALRHRANLSERDRAMTPVPVLLTMHGWDPFAQGVLDWVAERLVADFPLLESGPLGRKTARKLVHRGHIAVMLDGLDEMSEPLRTGALQALGDQATFRLVLLTRSDELAASMTKGPLSGAASLELLPLAADDEADYLAGCRPEPMPAAWDRLILHLRHCPDGVLAHALDTPLMLTLVRDTFSDPKELDHFVETASTSTRDAVESALLDRVVPAAFAPRSGKPSLPYSSAEAQRWLGFLAYRLNHSCSRDLPWWSMPDWVGAGPRVATTALIVGAAFGASAGFAVGTRVTPIVGQIVGLAVGAVFAFVAGLAASRPLVQPRQLVRFRWRGTLRGENIRLGVALGCGFSLVFGLAGGLSFGLRVGVASALLFGLLTAISIALMSAMAQPSNTIDSPVDPITCWRRDREYTIVSGLTVGLVFTLGGIMFAPFVGLLFGPLAGIAFALPRSATWHASFTFWRLRRAGLLPRNAMTFFEDARARHVLRTAGPVYQFRHASLQDRLADSFADAQR